MWHLDDDFQQVQHYEVGLGGQVPTDDGLLVQLCFRPDAEQGTFIHGFGKADIRYHFRGLTIALSSMTFLFSPV